jgi:hypothetical protein
MSDRPAQPDDGNPLGDLLERAKPDADFAAQQSMRALQSRLFGAAAQPVTMVGRWVIESRLGAGGGGTVYRAKDPETGTLVALKLLVSEGRGSGPRARLLREAQSLAKLRHPNIVEFLEVGVFDPSVIEPTGSSSDNGVFLAMEYVDGWNLAQWAEQPHPWQKVRDVFVAAGRGLAFAHERGFVHRDFKPSNVLVGKDGRVRVADFGLARATRELTAPLPAFAVHLPDEPSLPGAHIALTKPGTVIGTPAFMAPEQHLSSRADPRSDQFSFCLALYEALYRRSPYEGPTVGKILEAKLRGIIAPPPRDTQVPWRVNRAIVRGLAPDPMGRHGSMEELLAALLADSGGPRPARVAIGVAGVAVVIAGGIAWKLSGMPTPTPTPTCGPSLEHSAWDSAAQTKVSKAITGVGAVFGETTLSRVREQLDRRASEWQTARTSICERAEPDDAAVACLESIASATNAWLGAVERADSLRLEHAIAAASSLPTPSACTSASRDGSLAGLRDRIWETNAVVAFADPAAASRVDALAKEASGNAMAQAAATVLAGELMLDPSTLDERALLEAHAALVDGDLPGFADRAALLGLARAAAARDDAAAKAWLERVASGRPEIRARAEALDAERAWRQGARDRAMLACDDARKRLDDRDADPVAGFEVARRCATLGNPTPDGQAVASWETVAAFAERAFGSDHPVAAGVRIELARTNLAAGRRDAARPHAALGYEVLRRITSEVDARRLLPLVLLAELEPTLASPGAVRWLGLAATVAGEGAQGQAVLTRAMLQVADAITHEPTRARAMLELAARHAAHANDPALVTAITLRMSALPAPPK